MPNSTSSPNLGIIKSMECPRGSETTSSQHTVKTLAKAQEWSTVPVYEEDLPVTIHQDKTRNGRLRITVVTCNDDVLCVRS